jgi:hypothetical protein
MGQFPTHAPQQKKLLDHLVGATQQSNRKGKAERLGGLEIDDQFGVR